MATGATDHTSARPTKLLGFVLLLIGSALIGAVNSNSIAIRPSGVDPPLFVPIVLVIIAVNILGAGLVSLLGDESPLTLPKRRRILALRMAAANALAPGLTLGVFSVVRGWGVPLPAGQDLWQFVSGVIGGAAFLLAWRLWQLSQRHEAADANAIMALDRRPPVLYLRSFLDDADVILDDSGIPQLRRVIAILAPPTPEQMMTRALERLGPVIAIGKPGEALPLLGAARLYVANEQWQDRVRELMHAASLVVIRVGGSAGLLWEIDQALTDIPRQRIVFALLGNPETAPEVFKKLAPVLGASLEAGLPERPPKGWRYFASQFRRLGGLVFFDAHGAAHVAPIRQFPTSAHEVRTLLRPLAGPFLRAWDKVFYSLGLTPALRANLGFPTGRAVLALLVGWLAGMQLSLLYRLMA